MKYLASVLLVFLVCTAVFSGVVGVGAPDIREARRMLRRSYSHLRVLLG